MAIPMGVGVPDQEGGGSDPVQGPTREGWGGAASLGVILRWL